MGRAWDVATAHSRAGYSWQLGRDEVISATDKIHAMADAKGCLLCILLRGGQAHHWAPAQRLIRRTKEAGKLLGDMTYDGAD